MSASGGRRAEDARRRPATRPAQRAAGGDRRRAGAHGRHDRGGRFAAGNSRQQADARRLRAGAHGGDRARRPCRRRLRVPGTLSNNTRPDCSSACPAIRARWSIDAKFPLEAFTALAASRDEEARKAAEQRVRADVGRHVKDIAERYLIARRDAGHRADVRALGIDLRRSRRAFRRRRAKGPSRPGRHRLAFAAEHGDRGRADADPRRAPAGVGAVMRSRGRQARSRTCAGSPSARPNSKPISARRRRTCRGSRPRRKRSTGAPSRIDAIEFSPPKRRRRRRRSSWRISLRNLCRGTSIPPHCLSTRRGGRAARHNARIRRESSARTRRAGR